MTFKTFLATGMACAGRLVPFKGADMLRLVWNAEVE